MTHICKDERERLRMQRGHLRWGWRGFERGLCFATHGARTRPLVSLGRGSGEEEPIRTFLLSHPWRKGAPWVGHPMSAYWSGKELVVALEDNLLAVPA
jgi:hypothetical protein